ncbi:MAG: hypothetical protein SFX74_09560 [Fimbriimonadaceae bacterium]|nr:hypothetical protein [Fimbriimonadaceae bacterium]
MSRLFSLRIPEFNLRLWQMFLLSFPFYLLPSGMPRICDIFIVWIAIRFAIAGKVPMLGSAKIILQVLSGFVIYSCLVGTYYALILPAPSCLQSAFFYIQNALVVFVVFSLYSEYGRRFLEATFNAMATCVIVQFCAGLRDLGNAERATIFFNNPNQLGYFSLVSAALLAFGAQVFKLRAAYIGMLMTMCLAIAVISLSKAAMVGAAILILLIGLTQPKVVGQFALMVLAVLVIAPNIVGAIVKAEARLSTVGRSNDDSAEGRGYDRITRNPHYLAFGSAEGAYNRFGLHGQELHSTYGTIIFAYGIPGTALLVTFLYLLFKGQGWSAYPIFPVATYGITHNGMRFTLLWCLLAVSWCVAHYMRERRLAAEPVVADEGPGPALVPA